MIINKLVFPIKADLSFVEGGIPQGKLTANSINRDFLYVISPAVKATVITAFFQNQKQTEDTQQATFVLSDLSIDYLVSKDTSYYELVKDWNVWQTTIPSKALEFISYNRAGKIGISFAFRQLLEPSGYEDSQEIKSDDFVITNSGRYIIKVPYYSFLGNDFTYNDVLIYNGGSEVYRKPAIVLQGTTGTLEYSVDPSVYIGGYEYIDISLTESILSKLQSLEADVELKATKAYADTKVDKITETQRDSLGIMEHDDRIVPGVDGNLTEMPIKASISKEKNTIVMRNSDGNFQDLFDHNESPVAHSSEFNKKVDKVETPTVDRAIERVYGTKHDGTQTTFQLTNLELQPNTIVKRNESGKIYDLEFHDSDNNAHPDIRTMLQAVRGAFVYRGKANFTTEYLRQYTGELSSIIILEYGRDVEMGDVLVDLDGVEWYFNGDNWFEYGQGQIALATALNDGLLGKEDYAKIQTMYGNLNWDSDRGSVIDPIAFKLIRLGVDQSINDYIANNPVYNNTRYTYFKNDFSSIVGESIGDLIIQSGGTGLTPEQEAKLDIIKDDGDGTKVLADDGTYKEVGGGGYIEINYADLVALRNNSQLVPGAFYRITDYETTTVQAETRSAGHLFDIIVQALDEKTLSENAQAIHSERDVNGYFANSKLEAWKLKYCLDNDTNRFAWADEVNGKGVIYRMIDEFNNDVPYDFKNIQFKRKLTAGELDLDSGIDTWVYTFTGVSYENFTLIDGTTLKASEYFTDEGSNLYKNNKIGIYEYKRYTEDGNDKIIQQCNNIVFIGWYAEEPYGEEGPAKIVMFSYNNILGAECYNMTIGNDFYNNTIGNDFNNNTIGNGFYNNTIGNWFNNNTIGNGFYNNTIGNDFNNNTIGNGFYNNTIGNDFNSNTIGNGFYNNTIGNDFNSNTIGNDFYNNTIGDWFNNNTIENYFNNNTIGNSVMFIQFSLDGTNMNQIRYLHLKSGLRGVSAMNKLDLYYDGLYGREYPTTFELIANGNIVSSWEATPLTRAGKVKATNTTATWSDI